MRLPDFLALPHRVAALLLTAGLGSTAAQEDHPVHPDSQRQEGVPQGEVTQGSFSASSLYPGTHRDYWVYVPKQYDGAEPACLMVFQDGHRASSEKSALKTSVVFDNLIHAGDMPVTIGVFVDPGVVPAIGSGQDRRNRAFEYDTVSDRYARFLTEEFLPVALEGLNVSDRAADRAIAGGSSGGIAAFNAAWQRPDAFSRVFSWIGTFVGIRGGNELPVLVRKTEPRPLRVFLQDGSNDANGNVGSWWIANQDMLAALTFSGYEVDHAWGEGGHNAKHAAAIFPDVLRWLWKDWPQAPRTHFDQSRNRTATDFLIEGEDWELIADGMEFTEGPAIAPDGTLFFSDLEASKIYRLQLEPGAEPELWLDNTFGTNGLAFDQQGRLYGCSTGSGRILRWDVDTKKAEVLAKEVRANDIVVAHDGTVYFTEPRKKAVWCIPTDGREPFIAAEGYSGVNGVILSPDQTRVYAADYPGRFVWSALRQEDDSLAHAQPYFHLHLPPGTEDIRSHADGMCVDGEGRLFVASAMGIQICHPEHAMVHLILPPPPGARHPANVCFGPDGSTLIATCGSQVFQRRTRFQGMIPYTAPVEQ